VITFHFSNDNNSLGKKLGATMTRVKSVVYRRRYETELELSVTDEEDNLIYITFPNVPLHLFEAALKDLFFQLSASEANALQHAADIIKKRAERYAKAPAEKGDTK
jgi:hypothetical protein